MPCSQTLAGLTHDCAASMGGIVAAYIAPAEDVTAKTLTSDVISALTMATGKHFYKYTFPRNTGSLSSNATIDETTGANFWVSDLVLVFPKMETTKRVEIMALAQSGLVIVVVDANGKQWLLGYDAPVKASAGDGLTGTARADRNGYSITLQDNSLELPYEVSADMEALLPTVSQ